MPLNNLASLTGREEAARFDLENRIPENEALYRSRRAQRYPNLPEGQLPAEALESKEVYKQRQRENTSASHRYLNLEQQERQFVAQKDEVQRMYYKTYSDGIIPSGHRRLEPLAGELAEAEFRHARAREDTIKQHPFMDVNLQSKRKHHHYVQEHYNLSDEARDYQRHHARFMAASPPSNTRDLYGHEPSRDGQAYAEPYPPNFPPAGFYSTTRGSDHISSGDDWIEVKTSSSHRGRRGRK